MVLSLFMAMVSGTRPGERASSLLFTLGL